MAKLITMSRRLSKREELRRAVRLYEKRKEALSSMIERLRGDKNKANTSGKE